jgi:hypothetical protein
MSMDYNERSRMRYRTDPGYREKRKQYQRNYRKRLRQWFREMSDEEYLEEVVRPFFRGEID